MNDDQFDQMVAGFYQAGSGAMSWSQALDSMRQAMNAMLITIYAVESATGSIIFSHEVGDVSPEAALDYIRHYHQVDPRGAMALNHPTGAWVSCHEHFDDEYVAQDPFYQEFLIPYGYRFSSGKRLYENERLVVLMGIHRSISSLPLNEKELALAERLSKHLSEAMQIYCSNRRLSEQASVGLEILRQSRQSLLLINEAKQIKFMNDPAKNLLNASEVIFDRNGMLGGSNPGDDLQIVLALRRMNLSENPALGTMQDAEDRIFVKMSGIQKNKIIGLYMQALRPEQTMQAFGTQSLALVLLHDPTRNTELDPFVIAAMWDLSPAEARVAVGLACGKPLKDIARMHGVSLTTVRTQIKSAMNKMGTHRQAELVGMLASMPVNWL